MATLLTRLRSLIWPRDPRRYCLSYKLVPEPCAVGLDEPVVGCGKWIGKTYLPVPAISVRNFRRDRAACAGSQSKIVDQSGSRHCKVWCMRSPITTACCPRERILTQQWWGEWPGVGTSQNVSSSW